jgi:hypothetical protein
MTEWVTVELYDPAKVPPGIVTEIVGSQVAVLIPDTPVAVCTAPPGYSGLRLLGATVALPVIVAAGVV